ncbi:spermatogenesis-associated protein 20 [Hirsutella rhossiliensis]|uniref:Spermatogenesis-associated protein 20 n=1 Tax=Hirsutella rhossiliensis TaxID=111463 RepID=A0A9P8MNJ3_9HYPO|nr:spermatogenesis-associated protein 20 [Hirsutella rhossiliensis]KAH0958405.1 spermatogenesis-associated protein 20 [Hirsutella rhossiliensis]
MGVSHLTAVCSPIAIDGGGFQGGTSAGQPSTLRNRASSSKSPFVKTGQDSLVKWQLLDADSVRRAERENKLIFLHVGYRACHFCRIMALESFSNPECAAILNDAFVPVIVDREERPDIDTIYMNYVQAVSNVGGWPLNLFLTPELEPVFGGTFWPGPDFLTILRKVHDIWRHQEGRCRKEATEILGQLREFAAEGTLGTRGIVGQPSLAPPGELDLDQLEEACTHIAGTYDPVHAGFGRAPKFLTPPKLAFLLQLQQYSSPVQDVVGQAECRRASDMAIGTLRKIRDGSLRDHVGGAGFARCSVTPDWSLPNFEKLVVDNALLLGLYLDAWRVCGGQASSEFFDVVGELVEYLTSEPIALPDGCLASSEAADSYYRRGDSDMREGAWYLWTRREFDSVLDAADRHISPVVAAYWDVQEDGNVNEDHDPNDDFINQNIPRVVKTPEELAAQFSIPVETVEQYIQTAKWELKARRERERVRPALDNKVVTGWNGLVISALARAAAALKKVAQAKAERCLITARAAVWFIQKRMWDPDAEVLYRIWRDGRETEGFADDYAYLICGLLDLVDATGDESLLAFADTLQKTQIRLFHDPAGGFFSTTASSPHAILRLKDGMDTSLPSTNAVSAANLFRLGALLDDAAFCARARAVVNAFEPEMLQHPWLFPGLLAAVVMARLGVEVSAVHVEYKAAREQS